MLAVAVYDPALVLVIELLARTSPGPPTPVITTPAVCIGAGAAVVDRERQARHAGDDRGGQRGEVGHLTIGLAQVTYVDDQRRLADVHGVAAAGRLVVGVAGKGPVDHIMAGIGVGR